MGEINRSERQPDSFNLLAEWWLNERDGGKLNSFITIYRTNNREIPHTQFWLCFSSHLNRTHRLLATKLKHDEKK